MLSDSEEEKNPVRLGENDSKCFIGSVILGTGFLLNLEEAQLLIEGDERNADVLMPYLSGADLNSHPEQQPSRWAINFFDWTLERAKTYKECFDIVDCLVRPHRETVKRPIYREKWWQYAEKCEAMYRAIDGKERVLVVAQTSKYVAFAFIPAYYVMPMMTVVFDTDKYSDFSIYQSSIHDVWAWKYASTLESRLRYVPTDIAQTFPLPKIDSLEITNRIHNIGESYHEHRRALMQQLWLGLTDIYNLFHTRDLTPERVAKVSKKSLEEADSGYAGIIELRRLHVELDTAIRDAYGWHDPSTSSGQVLSTGSGQVLNLCHDFHEVETLPENDRVRYTISPEARKEVLKRLLLLNHQRAAEQTASAPAAKPKTKRSRKSQANEGQGDLFV